MAASLSDSSESGVIIVLYVEKGLVGPEYDQFVIRSIGGSIESTIVSVRSNPKLHLYLFKLFSVTVPPL